MQHCGFSRAPTVLQTKHKNDFSTISITENPFLGKLFQPGPYFKIFGYKNNQNQSSIELEHLKRQL